MNAFFKKQKRQEPRHGNIPGWFWESPVSEQGSSNAMPEV